MHSQYSIPNAGMQPRYADLQRRVQAAIKARRQRERELAEFFADLPEIEEPGPREVSPQTQAILDDLDAIFDEIEIEQAALAALETPSQEGEPATGEQCKIATDSACKIATTPTLENAEFTKPFQTLDGSPVQSCLVAKNQQPEKPQNAPLQTRPNTPPSTPLPTPLTLPSSRHVGTPSSSPVSVPASSPSRRRASPAPAPQASPRPSWRKASPLDKFLGSVDAASRRGGLAFSLDFGFGAEGSFYNSKDPTRLLSHRIAREMRKAFGVVLPFAFKFELAPNDGKLHVHGVLIPLDSSSAHRRALNEVLRRAGGFVSGRRGSRQCSITSISDDGGWRDYLSKCVNKTSDTLDTDKITFVSQDLLRLTREEWGR